MDGEGTEAFPELGKHCQESSCNQLDFLPFKCDACLKVFCLEHRSHKSHDCPKAEHKSRTVVVCRLCSMSMEKEGEDDEIMLARHQQSGECNPSNRKKPMCPVKRCRQVLTFSNTSTCKICHQKVCLKHRLPSDHACNSNSVPSARSKFLVALAARSSKGYEREKHMSPPSPSVKAY